MTKRSPVVLIGGKFAQLPSTDTLGSHAKFIGTVTTVPAISLGQTQTISVPMTSVTPGDALVVGEDISWVFAGPLPGGVNPAQVRVTGPTTVALDFTSTSLLSLQTVSVGMRITAHR